MKNPFSEPSSSERIAEDRLYEKIGGELAIGQLDKAAQARAIQDGGNDAGAVKKAYIKHRFSQLQAEQKDADKIAAQKHEEELAAREILPNISTSIKKGAMREPDSKLGLYVIVAAMLLVGLIKLAFFS